MAKNEVAPQSNQLPAFLNKGAAPRGSEHVTQDDLVIPRLELVQSISPCRKKTDPLYIEGAEEGMMFNSVTRELYGPEVIVVPVAFRKEFLLWKDRKKGGGFRGAFPTAADAESAREQLEDGEDVEVSDTAQHFCLLVHPDGRVEEIVMSLAKSKLKTSRLWNSLIRIAEVDSFAKWYKVQGVQQTNANGDDYYGFNIVAGKFVDEAVYRRAENLYKAIESGTVKASTEGMDEGTAASSSSSEY